MERPRDQLRELPVPQHRSLLEFVDIHLFQNFTRSRQRFHEYCLLIADAAGNGMQIFDRQREVLRKRAAVRDNPQHRSPRTVCPQSSPAKIANRAISVCRTRYIDFANDSAA